MVNESNLVLPSQQHVTLQLPQSAAVERNFGLGSDPKRIGVQLNRRANLPLEFKTKTKKALLSNWVRFFPKFKVRCSPQSFTFFASNQALTLFVPGGGGKVGCDDVIIVFVTTQPQNSLFKKFNK